MKKITIQQGIFLLSTLVEKSNILSENLRTYRVPLQVNGKDVVDPKKAKQMLEDIQELKLVQTDIITLKIALAKANVETLDDNKSLNQLLEEVRIKRKLWEELKNLLRMSMTKIENAIGVVQYGVMNEETVKEMSTSLEVEVNELSQKIDTINSSNYLEINLLTEK